MSLKGRDRPDLSRVRALIMAGGASSRFFPVNKVFADPTGTGRTMVQQALDRVTAPLAEGDWRQFIETEQFFVVTGAVARDEMRRSLSLPDVNILVEPGRRNTWPAILWALAHLRRDDPGATLAILTADHVIGDVPVFRETLAEAICLAQSEDTIVTIGILPGSDAREWMAFGAIKSSGRPVARGGEDATRGATRIERFEEKPSYERAGEMVDDGGWFWNAGMFVFRIDVAETALRELQPAMHERYLKMVENLDRGREDLAAREFNRLERKIPHPGPAGGEADNSIDFAIMMPLTLQGRDALFASVIPARFSWWDIGSWDALRRVVPADADGNLIIGDVRSMGVKRSILVAESGRRLEVRDLEGVVVVLASGGGLLVTREARAPDVKSLAAEVGARSRAVVFQECDRVVVRTTTGPVGLLDVNDLEVVEREGRVRVAPLTTAGDGENERQGLCASLSGAVHALRPVVTRYAWGGTVLPRLLGEDSAVEGPVAEAWLSSTQRDGQVDLESAPVSLAEFVAASPEVLGKWPLKIFGAHLPVFTKFLSTRFPARVHLGFRASAVKEAGGGDPGAFRAFLLERLRREQECLRKYLSLLDHDRIDSPESFARYRSIYEAWAVHQAESRWRDAGRDRDFLERLAPWLKSGVSVEMQRLVRTLRENRALLVDQFHEVDLGAESGNLLLSRAGSAHAILGLSHQAHPADSSEAVLRELFMELRDRAAGGASDAELEDVIDRAAPVLAERRAANRGEPKNEAWLAFEVDGETVIAEPQQTSNTTYSFLDMYTPFVHDGARLVFRKGDPQHGIGDEDLERLLREIAVEAETPDALRRRPREVAAGPEARGATLHELIDDPANWPYFTIHRVDLTAADEEPARWAGNHPDDAFQQIIVLRGALRCVQADGSAVTLSPGRPAFVPATLEGGYVLEAGEPASVLLVSVPTPRGGVPFRRAGS